MTDADLTGRPVVFRGGTVLTLDDSHRVLEGADVLVNISDDGWYGDSGAYAQHLNQTRMRAIENDRWLLSATDTGVTASIDPWGRIAARIPRKLNAGSLSGAIFSSSRTYFSASPNSPLSSVIEV